MPDQSPEDATLPPSLPDTTSLGIEAGATLPPAAAGLLRPGLPSLPITLGRYRLEQQLGQGGMGAVYRAYDTQLGRTVALKIPFLRGTVDDAIRARFLREAQASAALSHPNICPVHDLGEIDGVPYLTMAFLKGKTLAVAKKAITKAHCRVGAVTFNKDAATELQDRIRVLAGPASKPRLLAGTAS